MSDNYASYPQLVKGVPAVLHHIKAGKPYVTEHLSYGEIACKCRRPGCLKVDWSRVIHPAMLEFFEVYRAELNKKYPGQPILITSGCRCANHQVDISVPGTEVAAWHSPHVPIWDPVEKRWRTYALDNSVYNLPIPPGRFLALVDHACPELRLGFKLYKGTLLHADVAYFYGGKDRPGYWQRGYRF